MKLHDLPAEILSQILESTYDYASSPQLWRCLHARLVCRAFNAVILQILFRSQTFEKNDGRYTFSVEQHRYPTLLMRSLDTRIRMQPEPNGDDESLLACRKIFNIIVTAKGSGAPQDFNAACSWAVSSYAKQILGNFYYDLESAWASRDHTEELLEHAAAVCILMNEVGLAAPFLERLNVQQLRRYPLKVSILTGRLSQLLELCKEASIMCSDGSTSAADIIVWAAEAGNEALLRSTISPRNFEYREQTPALHVALMRAARANRSTTISYIWEMLIDSCADIQITLHTALVEACRNGSFEAAKLLLGKIKAPKFSDVDHGWPCLSEAVSGSHSSVVKLLVSQGVNINYEEFAVGRTALSMAAARGSIPIMKILLNAGASPGNLKFSDHIPLIRAAKYNQLDAVKLLLSRNAYLGARTVENALRRACGEGYEAIVRVLVESRCGFWNHRRQISTWPPLVSARKNGHKNIEEFLHKEFAIFTASKP